MQIPSNFLGRAGMLALVATTACAAPTRESEKAAPTRVAGTVYTVKDTTVRATFEASGTAEPLRQATLSTKLMGTVTAVLVHEGDAVRAGQTLVRIDARELGAKAAQVSASVAEADAMHRDALTQANRIRSLYADSAATRAQLDAAETGLARADAGLRAARAAAAEVGAMSSYAEIRAPFAGVVTRRFVDPGAFAAPGGPLVEVQDASQLRLTASAAPDAVAGLRAGQPITATVEGRSVQATIEGVVPAAAGNLYTINARVPNPAGAILAGSAATLSLPLGERTALVVPARAVTRDGDLTGVTLRTSAGDLTRWVRLGRVADDVVEVTAGLRAGDQVVVPSAARDVVAERN
ncbi:MAG TPA: efflux RND transporter periplasmic adaptor subunit [Gemmatimonadaceae bacterium]|nr:efflux RND transporter periplasmic adaptor subunit [Gemmatimonadaceae bacterium]